MKSDYSIRALLVLSLIFNVGAVFADSARTSEAVILLSEPTPEAGVAAVLSKGAVVHVLKRSGDYLLVRSEEFGAEGYMLRTQLTDRMTDKPESQQIATGRTTARVNLRNAPRLGTPVLAVVPLGEQLEILGREAGFLRVRRESGPVDRREGYLHQDYVRIEWLPVARSHAADGMPAEPVPASPVPVQPAVDRSASRAAVDFEPIDAGRPLEAPVTESAIVAEIQAPDSIATGRPTSSSSPSLAGWYLSADVGYAQGNINAAELDVALEVAGGFTEVRQLDESSPSWRLSLGYKIQPSWAVEVGLANLGEYQSQIDIRNADLDAVRSILADKHPVGGLGFRVAAVGELTWQRITFTAGLGYFRSGNTEINVVTADGAIRVNGKAGSSLLEAGVGYDLGPNWRCEFMLSRLELNQQLINSALKINYSF